MQAVRINSRGLQFIPPGSTRMILENPPHGRWTAIHCTRVSTGLCQVRVDNTTSIIFPSQGTPVVSAPPSLHSPPFFHRVPRCTEANTNRHTVIRQATNQPERHDVSLCNIVGGGGDFVFVPGQEVLYSRDAPVGFPVHVAIAILIVYLTICLTHNIEVTLNTRKDAIDIRLTEIPILALTLVCMFADGSTDVMDPFITSEDRVSNVILVGYIFYYTCRAIYQYAPGSRHHHVTPSPVNPLLASLAFAAMRIHMTLDNAYTVVAAQGIAVRLLNKVFQQHPHAGLGSLMDIMMDAALVSALTFTGVVPQNSGEPVITLLYVMQGAGLAVIINNGISVLEGLQDKTPAPP